MSRKVGSLSGPNQIRNPNESPLLLGNKVDLAQEKQRIRDEKKKASYERSKALKTYRAPFDDLLVIGSAQKKKNQG